MVKQKPQNTWVQKTKSQRHAKSMTDARLLLKQIKIKTSYSEYVCSICNTKGALLACIKCLKLFHLSCVDLTPLKIPLSEWPCPECSSGYSEDLLVSLSTFTESQKREKECKIRKLLNKLTKAKPKTKLKDFEAKYPSLVHHGKIVYPIDDSLLWSKPNLHQITFISFPATHTLNIQPTLVTDLIFICDFCYCFQGILATPHIRCETLYAVLNIPQETFAARNLHISLLKPLVIIMLKSESFRKKGPVFNYFIHKVKKIVGFDRLLENSYLTFIENIFSTDVWKDLIEDIDKEVWQMFQGFSFVDNYYSLPGDYKVRLLVLFIGLLLETKSLNEECNRRHESHMKVMKEISDLNTSKNKKGVDKEEIENQITSLKNNLKKLPVKSSSIGLDRHFREYFLFPWDSSRLYIKTSESLEQMSWTYYDKRSEIENFIQCLNEKGSREFSLLSELSELVRNSEFQMNEVETTSSDTEEEKNKHKETVNIFDTLKTWAKDLHFKITDALCLPVNTNYIKEIEESEIDSIIPLLIAFHFSFENSENKKPALWDLSEIHPVWELALNECKNPSEVLCCFSYLQVIGEKYAKDNKVVIKEWVKNENRRSCRLERLNRVKRIAPKEQDASCYLCGELGLVACCDRCPKVAHLECLGVEDLPEGEWICPACVEKANSVRVTRSKAVKY